MGLAGLTWLMWTLLGWAGLELAEAQPSPTGLGWNGRGWTRLGQARLERT